MARQKREVIPTEMIHRLLARRFCAPEWALLHEVRNATGFRRTTRTADAVALNLWPSRGMELYGFEVKASRGDLRKEIEDPEKSKEIMQYCDRWYLVIGHKDLIQPGELPPTWGLMVAQKNRLVSTTEAPKLEAKPLDRGLVASLLRNFTECYVPRSMLQAMVDEKYEEWQKSKEDIDNHLVERAQVEKKELEEIIRKFEDASGVNIRNRWKAGQIGDAVRVVMYSDFGQSKLQLKRLADNAQHIADQARRELEVIEKVEETRDDSSDRGNRRVGEGDASTEAATVGAE